MAGQVYTSTALKGAGLPNIGENTKSARQVPQPIYEGIVVDVIVDHTSNKGNYAKKDGYNVGDIKVRILSVDNTVSADNLSWASPLDSTIQQLPLIGELVVLHKVRTEFVYTRKVPLARRVPENGFINYEKTIQQFNRTAPVKETRDFLQSHKFGKYFKPDSRVRQLKHFEGDTLIQGRMGHSIRLGSSKIDPASKKLAPNIILRTGQAKDAEKNYTTIDSIFSLTLEDINADATSIWMTSDQDVSFTPTMIGAGSYARSIKNPPLSFGGAQILAVSDRIVLNARKNKLLLYSNDGIHLNSFSDSTIDTDSNIIFTANLDIISNSSRNIEFLADEDIKISAVSDVFISANEKVSIIGKKIHIGGVQADAEPVVGGTSLSIFLARLILTLLGTPLAVPPQLTGPRPVYPTLPPLPGIATVSHTFFGGFPTVLNPQIVAGLGKLYAELVRPNLGQGLVKLPWSGGPFSSRDVFVSVVGERTPIQKNDFKKGKPLEVKLSEWDLSKPYYRIT